SSAARPPCGRPGCPCRRRGITRGFDRDPWPATVRTALAALIVRTARWSVRHAVMPTRAVAPGQAAVFCDGERVLGGGFIARTGSLKPGVPTDGKSEGAPP